MAGEYHLDDTGVSATSLINGTKRCFVTYPALHFNVVLSCNYFEYVLHTNHPIRVRVSHGRAACKCGLDAPPEHLSCQLSEAVVRRPRTCIAWLPPAALHTPHCRYSELYLYQSTSTGSVPSFSASS